MTTVRHYDDIDFTVTVVNHELYAEFACYRVIGGSAQADESSPSRLYDRRGSTHTDPVGDLSDAQVYLHGSIKWDGCSNWNYDEQERVMLHFCRKEQAAAIGVLFTRMYEWAKELGQDRL